MILITFLVINLFHLSHSSAVPGESSNEAITIFEGITQDTLPGPDFDGGIWYSIILDGHYLISLNASETTDFELGLYSDNMFLVDSAESNYYPEVMKSYNLLGNYFIRVYPWSGSGDFDLNITSFVAIPGENFEVPINIEEGITEGLLPGPAEHEAIFYNITLNGVYTISLVGTENTDFDIRLTDENGLYVSSSLTSSYPELMTTLELNGNYIIEIYAYSGDGAFVLSVIKNYESSGSSLLSAELMVGNNVSGYLSGDSDWYKIELYGDFELTLTADDGTDFDLKLFAANNELLDAGNGDTYPEVINIQNANGWYFIEIFPFLPYGGSYLLEIQGDGIISTSYYDPFSTTTSDNFGLLEEDSNSAPLWIGFIFFIAYLVNKYAKNKKKSAKSKRGRQIDKRFKQVERLKRMKICLACETNNEHTALFCEECGTKL